MTEDEGLNQLESLLSSDLIRERQAGIALAARLLARGIQREAVRARLAEVAQKDTISIVRADAQAALDADARQPGTAPGVQPDYVFMARCPDGHEHTYDKHDYCPKNKTSIWRTVRRDGRQVDEVWISCKEKGCRREFYWEVECEGYR